ncbi:hypothetical protein NKH18_45210 [Streptomyces sp. M10(2022)]
MTDEIPVLRVSRVREPSRLFDEVTEAEEFAPHLRHLSKDSSEAVGTFLGDDAQRSSLLLMQADGYLSPLLLDKNADPIGYLKVSATLSGMDEVPDSQSANVCLESSLLHTVGVKDSFSIINAFGVKGQATMNVADPAQQKASFAVKAGGKAADTHTLNSGASAYSWQSLVCADPTSWRAYPFSTV